MELNVYINQEHNKVPSNPDIFPENPMALNTLARKQQNQKDSILEIEEQIERIGEDIRRLKIEFDIYFGGGTRKAPLQQRASLDARIKRINGNRDLSYANRYKLNNMVSLFNSYRQLWRRKLKAKGDEMF